MSDLVFALFWGAGVQHEFQTYPGVNCFISLGGGLPRDMKHVKIVGFLSLLRYLCNLFDHFLRHSVAAF